MSLYTRLIGNDPTRPSISVHQFMAAIAEWKRGQVTAGAIVSAFQLNAEEQADVVELRNRVQADQLTAVEIHDVCLLAQVGLFEYNIEQTMKNRFGV